MHLVPAFLRQQIEHFYSLVFFRFYIVCICIVKNVSTRSEPPRRSNLAGSLFVVLFYFLDDNEFISNLFAEANV